MQLFRHSVSLSIEILIQMSWLITRREPLTFLLAGLELVLMAGLLQPTMSMAQQPVRPLPRRGGCPSDYSSWGDYCLPNASATGAIERVGAYCPSGFETQGAFCVSFPNGREAIQKVGYSCPPDWDGSGNYCLKR